MSKSFSAERLGELPPFLIEKHQLDPIRAGDRVRAKREIAVIADRFGAPTSAFELARGIEQVARNLLGSSSERSRGLFHMTCDGHTNWADFAREIVAQMVGGEDRPVIRDVSSRMYQEKARRPANSRLNVHRLEKVHGIRLAHWRDALVAVTRRLGC